MHIFLLALECQTVWIQIQPDFLLEQIWVQKQFANNICTIKRCNWHVKKFKAVFFKISFIKTIIISNSLDEGQEQYSVWPDLGPNCLDSFLASKSWYYMYMYMCLFVNPCHAALGWVLLKTLKIQFSWIMAKVILSGSTLFSTFNTSNWFFLLVSTWDTCIPMNSYWRGHW